MIRADFDRLLAWMEDREHDLLGYKRGECASEEDVLQNFRQNADFLGVTPESLCFVYAMKHIQSIGRAVGDPSATLTWESGGHEGLGQRISDARNYLVLLAAILSERGQEHEDRARDSRPAGSEDGGVDLEAPPCGE